MGGRGVSRETLGLVMRFAKALLCVASVVAAGIVVATSYSAPAGQLRDAKLQDLRRVPALPRVSAHIEGRMVIGRYEFRSWPSDPQTKPWQIEIASVSSDSRYTPFTCDIYPQRRIGRIHQPLTLGAGPYKLLVFVRNRFGGHSRMITLPLRRATLRVPPGKTLRCPE
jgi:hypothetical protein